MPNFIQTFYKGFPRAGASNKGGVGEISSFSIFKREYIKNGSRYGCSYN